MGGNRDLQRFLFFWLFYVGPSPHLGWLTEPQGFLLSWACFMSFIRSVSPYRLCICCTLSGLMLPQTMCDPVTGPGTVTAVVQTMGSTLVAQHLKSMTWIRFRSPLGHSCQSFEVKSLAQNEAPRNCWWNGGYCYDRFSCFIFFSFFYLLHSLNQILVVGVKITQILIWRWCTTYIGKHVAVFTDHTPCDPITFDNETPSHHGCAFGI